MNPVLIVNPRAGGGKTGQIFGAMRAPIERALGPIDVWMTERSQHATDLAESACKEGRELVIAVGGDGTLNEVVNGLLRGPAGTRLGFIAQGTGGDFRRTLGLEHRLDRYLDAIKSGRERPLDVGKIRYRAHDGTMRQHHFLNIVSAGMGGLVDGYVALAPSWLGGKAAYFAASARALIACPLGKLHLTTWTKGRSETRKLATYMIAICNGRYFGSGMMVAPMAAPDDGRLEVVSLGAPSKLAFALFSQRIYRGDHLKEKGVEHIGCDRLTLDIENEEARQGFPLDVDGEPLGTLPLEVELIRNAIIMRA